MSFFEKLLNQIFPKKQQGKSFSRPLVTEPLKRMQAEISSYFEWQNSGEYRTLWHKLYQNYLANKNGQRDEWEIHLLQMPAANGFAFTYPQNIPSRHFQHLFDLLKDRILTLNYRLINADRHIYDKSTYVEMKEKYYLKPIIDLQKMDTPYNQLYGNIIIEYIAVDDKPSYLKLVANIYSDRLYTEALPFDELLGEIFQ